MQGGAQRDAQFSAWASGLCRSSKTRRNAGAGRRMAQAAVFYDSRPH